MQHVVEELIVVIPQADAFVADIAHGFGDAEEVLEELAGDILVDVIVLGQFQGDAHQVKRVHRHPARPVGLVKVSARRQLGAAVEHADIVEAEKPALEHVAAFGVLAIDPPGEIEHQLVEHALEEPQIAAAAIVIAVDLVHTPRGPGMHRRIDIAKGPLISGHLAVRVHVPLAREQQQLLLGKGAVQVGQWNAVERQIPGGIPRVLPLIRHRDDVGVIQMHPFVVATVPAGRGRRRLHRIALDPPRHVIAEVLLAPDHAGKGLSLNAAGVDAGNAGLQVGVKFIGFADALGEHSVKVRERALDRAWRQAQLYGLRAARRNLEREPDGGLRAGLPRIDGMLAAGHDTFMDAVLPVTRPRIIVPQAAGIRFVVAEQDRPWRTVSVQVATSQLRVIDLDGDMLRHAQFRLVGPSVPTPGIAKPQLGQQVERGGLGSAVVRGDTHQDVFVAGLSVLDHHIEIPVVGEGLRVDELEFRMGDAAAAILLLQLRVRELPLRVLVKHLQIGVGRSGIEVVIELLDVFTMVALAIIKPEQALLENRIVCVPQRQRQAQALLRVAEATDAILAPAVGATARVIVRKIIPGGAVLTVVFAHRAPLPLGKVGAPLFPGSAVRRLGIQAFVFRRVCGHEAPSCH